MRLRAISLCAHVLAPGDDTLLRVARDFRASLHRRDAVSPRSGQQRRREWGRRTSSTKLTSVGPGRTPSKASSRSDLSRSQQTAAYYGAGTAAAAVGAPAAAGAGVRAARQPRRWRAAFASAIAVAAAVAAVVGQQQRVAPRRRRGSSASSATERDRANLTTGSCLDGAVSRFSARLARSGASRRRRRRVASAQRAGPSARQVLRARGTTVHSVARHASRRARGARGTSTGPMRRPQSLDTRALLTSCGMPFVRRRTTSCFRTRRSLRSPRSLRRSSRSTSRTTKSPARSPASHGWPRRSHRRHSNRDADRICRRPPAHYHPTTQAIWLMARVLKLKLGGARSLLILDDVHWMDSSTKLGVVMKDQPLVCFHLRPFDELSLRDKEVAKPPSESSRCYDSSAMAREVPPGLLVPPPRSPSSSADHLSKPKLLKAESTWARFRGRHVLHPGKVQRKSTVGERICRGHVRRSS